MRILRGLSTRDLNWWCLTGIYETYDAEIVAILDARSPSCSDAAHACGNVVPVQTDISTNARLSDDSDRTRRPNGLN